MPTQTWNVPTIDDMGAVMQGGLFDAVSTGNMPLESSDDDRFGRAMTAVVARVRSRIQSFPGAQVSATANSVPPELMDVTCKLIAINLATAFPFLVQVVKDQTDQWNREWDEIKSGLKAGTFRVSAPPDPQAPDVQAYPDATVVRGGCPVFTTTSNSLYGDQGSLVGL